MMESIVFKGVDKIGWVKGEEYKYSASCPIFVKVEIDIDKKHNKSVFEIMGWILSPNGRRLITMGQINSVIRRLLNEDKIKPNTRRGWTMSDIRYLIDIWEKWYLNNLKQVIGDLNNEYSRVEKELPEEVVNWLVSKFRGGEFEWRRK